MRTIAALPRFSSDKTSLFHGVGEVGATFDFQPAPADINGDAARVFDTSWHWRRAAELLGADVEDLSATPACTYLLGANEHAVLCGRGKWYASPQTYIEHRLASAVSALPAADTRVICEMMTGLARAEQIGTSDATIALTQCESMVDYISLCSGALKTQPVPRALRAAFKKYGVFIPEMEEAGAVQRCANCSALPTPEIKLLSCPCKDVK